MGPNWEPTILGITIPSLFLPAIVVPTLVFGAFTIWPFLEARFTHDHTEHQLLQWPWQAPVRLGIGTAALAFFVVLTLAGGNDVLAASLHVGVEELTGVFRVLVVLVPIVAGVVAWRLGVERNRRDEVEAAPVDRLDRDGIALADGSVQGGTPESGR
jgi:ubiquinol-cytochrome c reductase cytochrome b subunit